MIKFHLRMHLAARGTLSAVLANDVPTWSLSERHAHFPSCHPQRALGNLFSSFGN
jgi:hypothetical protein